LEFKTKSGKKIVLENISPNDIEALDITPDDMLNISSSFKSGNKIVREYQAKKILLVKMVIAYIIAMAISMTLLSLGPTMEKIMTPVVVTLMIFPFVSPLLYFFPKIFLNMWNIASFFLMIVMFSIIDPMVTLGLGALLMFFGKKLYKQKKETKAVIKKFPVEKRMVDFYNSADFIDIKDIITRLHNTKKGNIVYYTANILFLILEPAILIGLFYFMINKENTLPFIFAGLILPIAYLAFYTKKRLPYLLDKDVKNAKLDLPIIKQKIMSNTLSNIDSNLEYNMKSNIDKSQTIKKDFIESNIVEANNNIKIIAEDIIENKQDIFYEFSEIAVQTEDFKNIFSGVFIKIDFNKYSSEKVFVYSKKSKKSKKGLKKVTLESTEFNSKFDVYATNENAARYILSLTMQEKMVNFVKKFDHEIYLSFVEGVLYITIPELTDLFELNLIFFNLDEMTTIRILSYYYNFVQYLYSFYQDMDLDVRLWSKK